MVTQKLLHNVTDHEVTIITSYPLGEIIYNHNAAGRISKWALELMGQDINSGAGVILISPDGNRLRYVIRLHFQASNKVVEYEALINGLRIAVKLSVTWLYVRGESKLVVDQVMKESSCKSPLMVAYCQEVRKLEDKFLRDPAASHPAKGQ
ncbi:uncharacterized protein [Setaria viridis]|uniref:uncharacterized protein n=1 Tax=Setaria viridis TaxID=4556 RepID=UPI003B3BDE49